MLSTSLAELGAALHTGKSERLLRYLDFTARFHHSSHATLTLDGAHVREESLPERRGEEQRRCSVHATHEATTTGPS
jgi:hypothetical protein